MDAFAEITCRELVEHVTDYLEGGLRAQDRMRFEEHLLACGGCNAHVDQMRYTIAVVGSLQEESIPTPVRDQLLEVFGSWKLTSSSGTTRLS